jgi:hypothetical protein
MIPSASGSAQCIASQHPRDGAQMECIDALARHGEKIFAIIMRA